MGSCSDLATKPEVAAKIDKSEKPEIVKASAATAVPIVTGILATYADEAAAIARQALQLARQGLSLAKSLLGQIAKIAGGLANILSLIGLLATQAQLLLLNNRVNQLTKDVRHAEGVAIGATWKAETAIRTGNAATERANTAISNSNKAINTANGIAAVAEQARVLANAANQEAIAARSEATTAKREANAATRTANYAVEGANAATRKADTAITESNQAKREANTATTKANTAIAESNKNAQELASLRAEVAQLKQQIAVSAAKSIALAAAVNTVETQVEQKEDKYIVRRVEQATITNASGIRDINGNLVGLQSKFSTAANSITKTVTQTLEGKTKEEIDKIKAGVGAGGISLEGAKKGVFEDLFGNTKANSQLKDVIGTEVSTQTKALEKVNEKQYTDLKNRVDNIPSVLTGTVAATMLTTLKPFEGIWKQTAAQTTPAVLSQAAAAGVCSTTAPGGCMNKNIMQPINNRIGDAINAAGTAAAVANNALLMRMSGVLNTVKNTTDVIKSTTNATLGIVGHATYGLQAVQNFASTAWKATHADKVLNAITTALVIHNGAMLSKNLTVTLGETASIALQAMGIRDSSDQIIDVNAVIKAKMNSLISSIVGAENYAVLTQKIAAANRIYQSAANMANLVQNLFDSARNVAELTAGNTGKIGNALREAGVVYEDAYELMQEKVNPQNQAQRKLEGLTHTLGTLEQGVSFISGMSSEVIEFNDNVTELKAERKQLADETAAFMDTKKTEKDDIKIESQVQTDVAKLDFARDETDS